MPTNQVSISIICYRVVLLFVVRLTTAEMNSMIIQKFDTVKDPEMTDEEAEYQMNKYVSNWEHSDDHLETEW